MEAVEAKTRPRRLTAVLNTAMLLAVSGLIVTAATSPAAAATTSGQFVTVGSGIGCDGSTGDGGASTPATVSLTRVGNELRIDLSLSGIPAQTYSVEVFESTGGCGSDDQAAIGSVAGATPRLW
ncbi:hypothetical protein ACFQY4_19375 [Catellatospora bangladeshensis]|uniref:hypothetical protein n=1 Tax=Catellatospora bangladeshensis TaxID=310355 RepID=UPI003605C348